MRESLLAAALLAAWTAAAAEPLQDKLGLEIGGYYKNLLVRSKTLALFPPQEPYLLDLNRLRLKFRGQMGEALSFDVQYDNEVLLGDYLGTAQFTALKEAETDTYFNLERTYVDNEDVFARHSIYRAYAAVALPAADLRLGRQRIAWGTAMFWNPMDMLNPYNPIQLEREERPGVDAALLDWDYSPLSRLSLVYARQRSRPSTAVRWRTNQGGFDMSLMAGNFRGDLVGGFDFAGQIGKIGVRGELTQTDSEQEGAFTRAVAGADYTFLNTVSLNIEIYYNGQGTSNPANYDFNRLLSGEMQSLARRYVGGYLGYEITPLLRWYNYLIINLDDHSRFFAPSLVYSLSDNLELTAGVQAFGGDAGSEYGTFENMYYAQFQWFF